MILSKKEQSAKRRAWHIIEKMPSNKYTYDMRFLAKRYLELLGEVIEFRKREIK